MPCDACHVQLLPPSSTANWLQQRQHALGLSQRRAVHEAASDGAQQHERLGVNREGLQQCPHRRDTHTTGDEKGPLPLENVGGGGAVGTFHRHAVTGLQPRRLQPVEPGRRRLELLYPRPLREIAADDVDVYSEKSPLGAAVLGAKVGETVTYTAPNGKAIKVAILEAQTFF